MGYVLGGAMLCFIQEGVRANAPLGAAVWWVQLVVGVSPPQFMWGIFVSAL